MTNWRSRAPQLLALAVAMLVLAVWIAWTQSPSRYPVQVQQVGLNTAPPASTVSHEPPAPGDMPSAADPKTRRWHDQLATEVSEARRHCGLSRHDVACAGDTCAIRHGGGGRIQEMAAEYVRQPLRGVYELAAATGALDRSVTPCASAYRAAFDGFAMPVVLEGVDSSRVNYCAVGTRAGEPADLDLAGALCNRLAEMAGEEPVFRSAL